MRAPDTGSRAATGDVPSRSLTVLLSQHPAGITSRRARLYRGGSRCVVTDAGIGSPCRRTNGEPRTQRVAPAGRTAGGERVAGRAAASLRPGAGPVGAVGVR